MLSNTLPVGLRFAQSARKHRVGRAHALYVMANHHAGAMTTTRGEPGQWWVGQDETGRELEIAAVFTPDGDLLIIDVMPTALRERKR